MKFISRSLHVLQVLQFNLESSRLMPYDMVLSRLPIRGHRFVNNSAASSIYLASWFLTDVSQIACRVFIALILNVHVVRNRKCTQIVDFGVKWRKTPFTDTNNFTALRLNSYDSKTMRDMRATESVFMKTRMLALRQKPLSLRFFLY